MRGQDLTKWLIAILAQDPAPHIGLLFSPHPPTLKLGILQLSEKGKNRFEGRK